MFVHPRSEGSKQLISGPEVDPQQVMFTCLREVNADHMETLSFHYDYLITTRKDFVVMKQKVLFYINEIRSYRNKY